MQSRYDIIKDPAERRFVARAQLCAAAVVVGLIIAGAFLYPADRPASQAEAARGAPTGPASSPLDTRPIGRGEGA